MTLTKKMVIGVLSLLLLIFMATYLITMQNTRSYFIEQLESDAQNTATSLGLSLSHAVADEDKATMLAMVQAVFDRGYFSSIEVRDVQGQAIVSRTTAIKPTVPEWFIPFVEWHDVEKSALVMRGWTQVGEVVVVSNANYLYQVLWDNAKDLVQSYVIYALLSLCLVYLFIHWLLRPLNRLKAQAIAIQERRFLIEKHIPKTTELKEVTLAMNQMVLRIRQRFQEQSEHIHTLQKKAYQDSLTGLPNRKLFIRQLKALLNNKQEFFPGFVMIIAIQGLDELNQKEGYLRGNSIIQKVAHLCTHFGKSVHALNVARMRGSQFALIFPEYILETLDQNFKDLQQKFYSVVHSDDVKIYMGAAPFKLYQETGEVLSEADKALKQAKEKSDGTDYYLPGSVASNQQMEKTRVAEAISAKNLSLYMQSVTNGQSVFHQEIYVRMAECQNELHHASYFMPIAEQLGIAHQVDLFVLETLKCSLGQKEKVAVNISADTLLNREHREVYLQKLADLPLKLRSLIHIELNESLIFRYVSETNDFLNHIKKLQINSGIDQVGLHFSSMHYLSDLPITYIKLHGSLIYDIVRDQSKQFFLYYFNEMAKTLDLQVIATQVESSAQWKTLQTLSISWGQGLYLASIEPINHS
ncbi:two component histidine kinase [Legionella gratiana]|uniref:Two component histidine kinase n=1 Tax=Legionella gratiana TaxID=45066 RepID=A0A378J4X4_9GAMM|nr:EAL domain-containing protein [Legionella gratiana]KTD14480.1 two component histidine kinase [Legionella gratiana]STX42051.1 two component histidine kinase, GGDEF domain protein/EAL domain protein [Legionella gratiana]